MSKSKQVFLNYTTSHGTKSRAQNFPERAKFTISAILHNVLFVDLTVSANTKCLPPHLFLGTGSGVQDPELVQAVMRACHCTEQRAISLLKISNNDIAKAQRHHAAFMKYVNATKPVFSNPVPALQKVASSDQSGSRASSIYSVLADTPPPEEELPEKPSYSLPLLEPLLANRSEVKNGQHPEMMPYQSSSSSFEDVHELDVMVYPPDNAAQPSTQDLSGTAVVETDRRHIDGAKDLSLDEKTVHDQPVHLDDWDFILPEIPPPRTFILGDADENDLFSPNALVQILQNMATVQAARNYLESYSQRSVQDHINDDVHGFPTIFYAVATNNKDMVRLFLEFGADACAVHKLSRVPLLAFAIVNSATLRADTTAIVSVLLCHGASPLAIPRDIFAPYTRDPVLLPKSESDKNLETTKPTEWCNDAARLRLAKAANISQRYYRERATKIRKPAKNRRQIAQRRNAENLLGIPYFLVGQSIATELLTQRLLTHLMMPTKRPLVLCFTGPSGHGKTELARQLGHLLSLDLEVVDCTIINREIELFGPYSGAEKGSRLNNFLANHAGQRCIIFLDEFEKTTKEIHQSMLIPFDNGEYQDRRNQDKIDCSNTIWILATNALDNTILEFCQQNDPIYGEDETEKSRLSKKLSRQLQEAFLDHFDAPVTGRVSDFVPFLPFSAGEQAVITHKSLLELAEDLRRPICLAKGPDEQLVGDIRLLIRKDATVCTMLAEAHYHRKLGARSLKAGAKKVERIVLDAYLDEEEGLQENGGLRDFVIDVQGGEIVGRGWKEDHLSVDFGLILHYPLRAYKFVEPEF